MFERNIIDLVGLFVENVQSLYPFLHKVAGGAAGPRAGPRLQLNEGREGEPSAQTHRMPTSGVPF